MPAYVLESVHPGERTVAPASIELPSGYRIEPYLTDLTFPSAITWDVDRALLVAESGLPLAGASGEPRILRRAADGAVQPLPVAGGLRPIQDLLLHWGLLYAAERGRISVIEGGARHDLIAGLPAAGDGVNTALTFARGGRLFFAQGTVSNAGIVEPPAEHALWQEGWADAHDTPGASVVLTGLNLPSRDPRSGEARPTGPFMPWGQTAAPGQRLPAPVAGAVANGAIMSARLDGSDLRVHAWGLRRPHGLAFAPDGRLYATNEGAQPAGPRPIAGDTDTLWRVEEGAWYGWPDFFAGEPPTQLRSPAAGEARPTFLLANHVELLRGHTRPPLPVARLGEQVAARSLDFCRGEAFGFCRHAFVAEFGAPCPGPAGGGHRIVRVDLERGTTSDFAVNRGRLPASLTGNNGGFERPVQARFGPDGCLYVVDMGFLEWRDERWHGVPRTGVVWRIVHAP